MMLYLTGAEASLKKSDVVPQNDYFKSLGGYVSSTPVPNGEMNALFDLISAKTLNDRLTETIGLGLINVTNYPVNNIKMKMVVDSDSQASWKVAVVELNDDDYMESIPNRYALPIIGEFHNIDFVKAYVEAEILNVASKGEEIAFFPFDVQVTIERGGDDTIDEIVEAFNNSETYSAVKLSAKRFRILLTEDTIVEEQSCDYVTTEGFRMQYDGTFKNGVTNEVTILDETARLDPEKGYGIWLQRNIKASHVSNEELLRRYKEGYKVNKNETAELVISFDVE